MAARIPATMPTRSKPWSFDLSMVSITCCAAVVADSGLTFARSVFDWARGVWTSVPRRPIDCGTLRLPFESLVA